MTDKRRMAVSYGSFSCVIEGFDDPFTLMRDIISFYHQVSQEEPEFAHFHEIVDMQELKTLLERDMGDEIELEPIAGGVYARRIEPAIETPAGAGTGAAQAPEDQRAAQEDGGQADTGHHPQSVDDDSETGTAEVAGIAEPANVGDRRDATTDGPATDEPRGPHTAEPRPEPQDAAQADGDAPAISSDSREEVGRTDIGEDAEDHDEPAQPASAPIRLHAAPGAEGDADEDRGDEDSGAPDRPAFDSEPIRLRHADHGPHDAAGAADPSGEASTAEPAHDRLTLGAPLRLEPENAIAGDPDEDAADEADGPAGAFIDRVAGKDETRDLLASPQPLRHAPPPEDEPPVDVSIAQIRSDPEAQDEPDEPKKTGSRDEPATPKKTVGLRMGSFLRRKSPAPSEKTSEEPASGIAERKDTAPDNAGRAEKPRSLTGGTLRVIRSGEDAPAPVAEDAPAPQDAPPAVPEAQAPEVADPPRPEPTRADRGDADPLKSRLHASFGSMRDPASAKESVDLDAGELHDADSPRGFAQRVGAASVPELMAAAAAFRLLIDGKTTVTRTDIMETVQMIMGEKPLSAEAKVKAFGKLVRGGELTRLDGGTFTLAPEQIESFQERFDAARHDSATGG